MYPISQMVLPIYNNGHGPLIKTGSDVTLNLSSDYSKLSYYMRMCINPLPHRLFLDHDIIFYF